MQRRSSILASLLLLSLASVGTWAAGPPADCPPPGGDSGLKAASRNILPPVLHWDGASRGLALRSDSSSPWLTHAEASDLRCTPSYDETVSYLEALVASSPQLHMVSLGRSGEGREIWMVVASKVQRRDGGVPTPAELHATGEPVVFAQAGIHSGEIDGKDAGLMLLRDMVQPEAATDMGRRAETLLDGVHFLFVPIFNVDGHERKSRFARINQRGPEVMGWRSTATNLNLNRDYAKADSPEMQAMLRALGNWQPDLYVDLHVTDGIDYQYDITWGYAGEHTSSPSIHRFLKKIFDPAVSARLAEAGHVPGYLVFATDSQNPTMLFHWNASGPRYSDGYGGWRHLPTILVENHSLKPYDQRVLGTRVFLEALLDVAARQVRSLRTAIDADRATRPRRQALGWTVNRSAPDLAEQEFLGVEWKKEASDVTGADQIRWLGLPTEKKLSAVYPTSPTVEVELPSAYWIPAPWQEVIERLRLHGVEMETLERGKSLEVDLYRVDGAVLEPRPFEGRARVSFDSPPTLERRTIALPAGSVRVPVDQPLGLLAAVLLEPQADDSFFRWGFFLHTLTQPEYVEAYVMEPMARRMLAEDEELRAEYEARLEDDPDFAASPRERLQFFYRRTPFYDERYRIYPVAREP
ncbi:MAG: M14 family metallopeptidase [Thermoanaerobaculia bacterium]|nr:M14 family metallopeptidase [Thermoanaerobaculia bacterium]